MNTEIVNVVVIGTGRYFILAMRLISRFNYFYTGNKTLNFYLFSDKSPEGYIDTSNVRFIDTATFSWEDACLFKFPAVLNAANEECDYVIYIDADTTINTYFDDSTIFADLFAMRHLWDGRANCILNHEGRQESAAYVDKDTARVYYQACYFGGKREAVIPMIDDAAKRLAVDKSNGLMAVAEDESYLQNYLINNDATLIDWEVTGFPFRPDKGVHPSQFDWGKHMSLYEIWPDNKYKKMLLQVKGLYDNGSLWDIVNSKIIKC